MHQSIHYLIAQADPGLSAWLVEQLPVVVVMGVVIWWLARRLERIETQKNNLAESMVKLTTLYEEKVDKNEELARKTMERLDLIIEILKHGKGA